MLKNNVFSLKKCEKTKEFEFIESQKCFFFFSQAEQSRQANVIAAEGDARAADLIGKALGEAGDGSFFRY